MGEGFTTHNEEEVLLNCDLEWIGRVESAIAIMNSYYIDLPLFSHIDAMRHGVDGEGRVNNVFPVVGSKLVMRYPFF